jgi:predicted DNA-binding protein
MRANLKVQPKAKDQITTARLPMDTRYRLDALARAKNKTKSQIIIDALEFYYNQEENELDSFTLGLPYFGKYDLGDADLSTTYKERLTEMLRARQNSY